MKKTLLSSLVVLGLALSAQAADDAAAPLIPVKAETVAQRQKAIAAKAPKGATLVAFLDCGSQRESQETSGVKIKSLGGKPFQFPEEAGSIAPTASTIFFDDTELQFDVTGLDARRRYLAVLSWWDFDNSGRTQAVLVGSPDRRRVQIAIPAVRLPNHKVSKQPPAERKFSLPASFADKGVLRVTVQLHSGANCVASELWIWQID